MDFLLPTAYMERTGGVWQIREEGFNNVDRYQISIRIINFKDLIIS